MHNPHAGTCHVIIDDGVFYIELNENDMAAVAAGFLQRRCEYGLTTPAGHECVGSFGKAVDGTWHADVDAPWDGELDSDCTVLVRGVTRLDAIAALWAGRHGAHWTQN